MYKFDFIGLVSYSLTIIGETKMKSEFSRIEQLSQKNAEVIANNWHYDGDYAFYDMKNDPEDYEEIVTPELRSDHYFQILDENGQLSAFFCLDPVEKEPSQVEVGLGMAPELTGHGRGLTLMKIIQDFVEQKHQYKKVILTVAEFNQRAQKVYQKAGYQTTGTEDMESNGGTYKFVVMEKALN